MGTYYVPEVFKFLQYYIDVHCSDRKHITAFQLHVDILIEVFLNFFSHVLYSTVPPLPPLRFHCVGGCWDRTQNCCDFDISCQTLQPLSQISSMRTQKFKFIMNLHIHSLLNIGANASFQCQKQHFVCPCVHNKIWFVKNFKIISHFIVRSCLQ